jgi:hypothetical protein
MKQSHQGTRALRRCIALALSSVFLLFLSLSQPHRVHHFFEGHSHSHDESRANSDDHRHGQDQTNPAQTECVVQSVAQNCHLGQAALVELPFVEARLESFDPQTNQWVDLFTSFSFLQRAPPRDTLLS